MTIVAIILLIMSNAFALLEAAKWRRRTHILMRAITAYSPHGVVYRCECSHTYLPGLMASRDCCGTRHMSNNCTPLDDIVGG